MHAADQYNAAAASSTQSQQPKDNLEVLPDRESYLPAILLCYSMSVLKQVHHETVP